MRRERILLALGLALAPTPSPAGKGSSGSGSPPPARPAAAPVPAAKPAAGFPATWPTNAEVFAGAKAGDWVAYTQSASQGGQVRSMSLWQTYEGGGAGGSVVAQATAPSTGAPGAPPAPGTAGVQAQRLVLKPGDPFQGAPMIPGATVVRDSTRSQPFAGLAIGTAEYAGTRFVRDLAVRLPAGVELGYTITLWLSPQVPGPGMVKHMTELSPMAGVSVVQLVTSSRAVAEAAAALAFESPADVLRYGEAAAKRAWPAGAKDWDRLTEQKLYAEARVRTLLALGRAAEAEKAFGALDPGSPGRYALGEELRRAAALRDDPNALGVLGVPAAERAEAAARYKAAALAARPGESGMEALVAFVKAQADVKTRAAAFRAGLARAGRTEAEGAALLAALPDDAERQGCLLADLPPVYQEDLDPVGLEGLARIFPPLAAAPRFQAVLAKALVQVGRGAEAKPLVEKLLATLEAESAADLGRVYEAGLLLEAARDPRLATYRRRIAKAHVDAAAKERAKAPKGTAPAWVDPELPRYHATLGDREKARALLATSPNLDRLVEVVPALYGPGGKPAEAIAWRDALVPSPEGKAAGAEFRLLGLRAELDLGFARWERIAGNPAGYRARLAAALDAALAGNRALIAWNAALPQGKRLFWQVGGSRLHQDPHHFLAAHLVAEGDPEHDSLLLDFLAKLGDELPATGAVGDAWHDSALAAGRRPDPGLLEKILVALPPGLERNWRTAVLSESIRPQAARGDLALVDRLVAARTDPEDKAELLRAAIIAQVEAARVPEAAARLPALAAAVGAGASGQHRAYATVAVALGLARAGRLAEARTAFLDRTDDLRESAVHRRFNGREWPEVIFQLGLEVGRRVAGPAEASAWCRDSRFAAETALLALGLASGLASGP